MVGGYTDVTNPWVRGGFYSLAKPANGGTKERENMAGKMSGKKWREIRARKYDGIKERENMAEKMRGNLCTSFN
jgi:hypothetical protein